ncbi:hypothetical protein RchiOBHm_Chr5g0035121 [Rosa chinensis]|uniref:Root cap/late embryogenesis-like protein n=1 Tax=Rosa chinensis TaxID=74649 RepID=A0A2P6QB55_ROSCH|nr:uncharacterized protein LOC112168314 [Rosa chinensis]PRQ31404.1 hypothetical protein RchiOBHm_Chr5g0035121 [Rosa chinensis]
MEVLRSSSTLIIVLVCFAGVIYQAKAYSSVYCTNPASRCYGKTVKCPYECPTSYSEDPKAKICYIDCDSPICKAHCKQRKPNCNSPGSACYDPRFIGGDGIVFYFHGKSNEQFSLVSDKNLQINGRFIGHRPAGRARDYTWIQALGVLLNSQSFSVEATKVATWNNQIDHLRFTHNGNDVVLEEGYLSTWYSPEKDIKVERIASKNSVIVSLKDVAEIMINVVPVTKEDDRIHNYQVPENDCFAHLEAQFKFFALSPKVEGVLGRTYRPDFENPAKPGVAMPVIGGEEKYRTTSLLSADCATCDLFSKEISESAKETSAIVDYGTLDCTRRSSGGYGIVCKK